MYSLKETIIVEGKYDKIRLSGIFDANIIETNGFNIYKNKKMIELLKRIADKNGVIIFTDSDTAGFRIRNYLKNCLAGKNIKHVFIPEIKGKEKRKPKASSEGFLGVEAMDNDIIIDAFKKCGINFDGDGDKKENKLTKVDLYKAGLYGTDNSSEKRKNFLKKHNLPEKITPNLLLDILNGLGIELE